MVVYSFSQAYCIQLSPRCGTSILESASRLKPYTAPFFLQTCQYNDSSVSSIELHLEAPKRSCNTRDGRRPSEPPVRRSQALGSRARLGPVASSVESSKLRIHVPLQYQALTLRTGSAIPSHGHPRRPPPLSERHRTPDHSELILDCEGVAVSEPERYGMPPL